MTSTTTIDTIRQAADRAASEWTGWDWSHDPAGVVTKGPGAVDDWAAWEADRAADLVGTAGDDGYDGEPSVLSAEAAAKMAAAERAYGEGCQGDAAAAWELGTEAVKAAEHGDLHEALHAAGRAASLESGYGDCPAYSGLVAAIEQAIAAEEEEREVLTSDQGEDGVDVTP